MPGDFVGEGVVVLSKGLNLCIATTCQFDQNFESLEDFQVGGTSLAQLVLDRPEAVANDSACLVAHAASGGSGGGARSVSAAESSSLEME